MRATTCYRLAVALGAVYLRERERRRGARRGSCWTWTGRTTRRTAHQEGTAYHGYYRQHMYHPLLVFDGDTDQLVTAVLRPGQRPRQPGARSPSSSGWCAPLRARWPGVADRAARRQRLRRARPVRLVRGRGHRLHHRARPQPPPGGAGRPARWPRPRRSRPPPGRKVRLAGETAYQAGSWPAPAPGGLQGRGAGRGPQHPLRRHHPAPTRPWPSTTGTSTAGEPENWIKDLKRACFADRLSDHRFVANQFRLLLHAAAYWLLDTLRRWLVAAGAERLQLDTLRLRLLKIGGRVRELLTRVRLHLATSHPGRAPLGASSPPAQAGRE